MKYYGKVDREEVIAEWAKRENVSPKQISQNRAPLLEALPKDTIWFKVRINKVDLDSLKVINGDIGWQIVSDFTGKIKHIVLILPSQIDYKAQSCQQFFYTFHRGRFYCETSHVRLCFAYSYVVQCLHQYE